MLDSPGDELQEAPCVGILSGARRTHPVRGQGSKPTCEECQSPVTDELPGPGVRTPG
jgi:hypothetical protein